MASKNLINVGNPNLSQSPKTSLTRDVAATSGTTLTVMSTTGFSSIATPADNYYVLIGTYGSENSEIVLVSAKTDTTFTISAPKFSHSASDPVVFIPYNQVKIYGKVLSGDTPVLLSTVDIDSSQQYTSYDYTPTAPVYVFFVTSYYNSYKTEESSKSDEISLGVFTVNSVKKIIESGLRKAMTKVDENPNGLLSWSILIDLVNEGIAEILTRKKKWQCLHKRIAGDNTVADVEYIEKPEDLSVLEFLLVNGTKLDYITKYQYNQITQN